MKFLFIIFGDLSADNSKGRANFNYNLVKFFNREGNKTEVYCLDTDSESSREFYKVEPLLSNKFYLLIFRYGYFFRKIFRNWNERKFKEKIFDRFVKKNIEPGKYDLIIITKPVIPWTAEKIRGKKVKLFTFATIAHPEFNRDLMQKLEQMYNIKTFSNYADKERSERVSKTFTLSDKIILTVNSPFLKKTYLNNNIPKEKIIEFNSDITIDTDFFIPKREGKNKQLTFLTLGYMNLIKGIPLMLDAWEQFKNKNANDFRLVVAGPLSSDLRLIMKKYDLQKLNVELLGKVKRDEIVGIYNSADVFISPSFSDLGPETIPEAMSCGLPVISSRNCGNAKYIDEGINGFTYEIFDSQTLVNHFEWFGANKERISEMGINARRKAAGIKNSEFFNDFYNYCST